MNNDDMDREQIVKQILEAMQGVKKSGVFEEIADAQGDEQSPDEDELKNKDGDSSS